LRASSGSEGDQLSTQAVLDRERFEHDLAFGCGHVEIRAHEIGESSGLGDLHEHLLDGFLGQPAPLRKLGRAFAHLTMKRDERVVLGIERL